MLNKRLNIKALKVNAGGVLAKSNERRGREWLLI